MEMVAHCLTGLPDEACGLLVGSYGGDEAAHLFVTPNAAGSAVVYQIDPKEMLRVDRAAQAIGADIMGVFHSHTHTDAYPSPTDVVQATDPGWHYVLVSLRDIHPVVRSYLIRDGVITEEPVVVPGLQAPGWEVREPEASGTVALGMEAPGTEPPRGVPGDLPGLEIDAAG
jgi:[CysO sulfur-carrier protein]-S-L-cysteine hydrolase